MTNPPALGICFDRAFGACEVADYARRVEQAGLAELWLIEDCFFTTAPPLAAAALTATEQLTVGLGVLPAVARTAAVTAMEIATLESLAPGRVVGGIGHGVQSWMAQMGVRPASPVTALREALTVVRQLLAGETVDSTGDYVTARDITLEHRPQQVPPVVAGVRGPRSLAMTGEYADGVLLDAPCPVDALVAARRHTGRTDQGFQHRCYATLCVLPDRQEARRIAAPFLAEMVGHGHSGLRATGFFDDLQRLVERHGTDWADHAPDEWWTQLGAIGNLDDAVTYVDAMRGAGIDAISFFPADELPIALEQIRTAGEIAAQLG
ncbi:LLM class flavin-dependent oxidoreductase [Flexivirga meconopsidis]|uniref:LLM class flavin-dependent oxidoreductase n=1 Tax=Flexivirga meconopsidis TaxID=2977121 RepID=UPI00223FA74F|nr:LLM class flavin-dependent oxidoreductase [Flexivirga meconopsidis]